MTLIEAIVTCEVVIVYENIRMCLLKHRDMYAGYDVSSSCCQLDHRLEMIGQFDNENYLFQGGWYLAPRMDGH